MAAANAVGWKERDFENYFVDQRNSFLPDKEPIIVIERQESLRRMVDLIALDRDGALVIIEVKNEEATREAVGQALEYLAQYQDTTVEDCEERFETLNKRLEGTTNETLKQRFIRVFGRPLPRISKRRRVFIAAPRFGYHSDICADYLSNTLAKSSIEFGLLEIREKRQGSKRFDLAFRKPPKLLSAEKLKGLVQSTAGSVYYVLKPGPEPVMWLVGRRADDNRLQLPGPVARKHLVRRRRKAGIMLPPAQEEVDVSRTGAIFQRVGQPMKQARLLGVVRDGTRAVIAIARFRHGEFERYQLTGERFFDEWKETPDSGLPDWKDLAT